jgi:hypothetical protein
MSEHGRSATEERRTAERTQALVRRKDGSIRRRHVVDQMIVVRHFQRVSETEFEFREDGERFAWIDTAKAMLDLPIADVIDWVKAFQAWEQTVVKIPVLVSEEFFRRDGTPAGSLLETFDEDETPQALAGKRALENAGIR